MQNRFQQLVAVGVCKCCCLKIRRPVDQLIYFATLNASHLFVVVFKSLLLLFNNSFDGLNEIIINMHNVVLVVMSV